jgi:hypothetical protein
VEPQWPPRSSTPASAPMQARRRSLAFTRGRVDAPRPATGDVPAASCGGDGCRPAAATGGRRRSALSGRLVCAASRGLEPARGSPDLAHFLLKRSRQRWIWARPASKTDFCGLPAERRRIRFRGSGFAECHSLTWHGQVTQSESICDMSTEVVV